MRFFWDNYIDVALDHSASADHVDIVRRTAEKASIGSPLGLAVLALAVNFTYAALGLPLDSNLPCHHLGNSLISARSLVNKPTKRLADETLMTIMLLGACDMLNRLSTRQRPSGIHKVGALALVEARGPLNLKSEMSRRLLIGVRHHVIKNAMMSHEKLASNPILWSPRGSPEDSAVDILGTYAARLANLQAKSSIR